MNPYIAYYVFVPLAYLLGSVPFGFLIARAKGIDIRTSGSGNIGATNVLRSVGKSWGALTLLLDALKGLVPAAVFPLLANHFFQIEAGEVLGLGCGCAAILGHNFPVFLKFKGGKGVATTAGVLIGVAPLALAIGFATFVAVVILSRMVSLGSIIAALAIPAASWFLYSSNGYLVPSVLTFLGVLVVWRHRANIARIINGTENRINLKGKK
jgi:glycerol-3-phosphate acyltransferase PlsY